MRILQLCNKPPFPATDGGALAMSRITEGLLNAGHQVHVFSLCTYKHPQPTITFEHESLSQEWHNIETERKFVAAITNLISNTSYNISRFDVPAVHEALKNLLQKETFDIIHLESLFTTPYINTIRENSQAPIIYRSHNVEYQIWEQLASQEKKRAKKWYLAKLAKQLKEFELAVHQKVDGVASISTKDLEFHKTMAPSVHIPVGMDLEVAPRINNNTVFHLGSMDWQPNADGVRWFLDKVWPLVYAKNKNAEFHFAGKGMPDDLKKYRGKNIFLHETVTNAQSFMRDHNLMVIPLLVGSGVRIKAIEAMGLGKTVVSTSIGSDGIPGVSDVMRIADSPELFAENILELLNAPHTAAELGHKSRKLFKELFDLSKSTQQLISFYQQYLRR
ncbi:MAG: glycosyltransferase involved in cell wall biosynthesis [Flavobacteriales bacterium]|jgi:glycosyltransferase involved in cell wall biosynthesis